MGITKIDEEESMKFVFVSIKNWRSGMKRCRFVTVIVVIIERNWSTKHWIPSLTFSILCILSSLTCSFISKIVLSRYKRLSNSLLTRPSSAQIFFLDKHRYQKEQWSILRLKTGGNCDIERRELSIVLFPNFRYKVLI